MKLIQTITALNMDESKIFYWSQDALSDTMLHIVVILFYRTTEDRTIVKETIEANFCWGYMMGVVLSEIMLRANTALFAQKVTKSLEDFFNITYEIQARSLSRGFFKSTGTFTVIMHFSGTVQGDFVITTAEKNAEKLALMSSLPKTTDYINDHRSLIAEYFTELLNVSSGQTLPELEKKFGSLYLTPPNVIFGELRQSQVISGNVDICNAADVIRCTLSLNMAGLSRIESQ